MRSNLCRICDSKNMELFFTISNEKIASCKNEKERFSLYNCSDCKSIFIKKCGDCKKNISGSKEVNYFPAETKLVSVLAKVTKFISFSIKRRLITKALGDKQEKIRILDIGCGNGDFLLSLPSLIFEKIGVEIDTFRYNFCKGRGIRIYNLDLLKTPMKSLKFDAITLIHVLEHLERPVEFLRKINSLLSDDGVLLVSTPNTDSLGFKLGKEKWYHLNVQAHVVLFNENSFRKLCERTGFIPIKKINEFYDYFLDLFESLKDSKYKFLIYPFYFFFKLFLPETVTYICKKYENLDNSPRP